MPIRRTTFGGGYVVGMALLLCGAVVGNSGCASKPSFLEGPSAEDRDREREATIELGSLGDHPWAGKYSTGPDTIGQYVVISPRVGVLEGGWSCLRPRTLHFLGPVDSVSEHTITINPEETNDRLLQRLGGHLVRFRWGERRYVAWPRDLARAKEKLESGMDLLPEYTMFMLHLDDNKKEPGTTEELEATVRQLCESMTASAEG